MVLDPKEERAHLLPVRPGASCRGFTSNSVWLVQQAAVMFVVVVHVLVCIGFLFPLILLPYPQNYYGASPGRADAGLSLIHI